MARLVVWQEPVARPSPSASGHRGLAIERRRARGAVLAPHLLRSLPPASPRRAPFTERLHEVFTKGFECVKFRRILREENLQSWFKLMDGCCHVQLSSEPDKVSWVLTKSGEFSVKSLYQYLCAKRVNFPYCVLWKLKLPLRVKVIWLVVKNRILTRDNLRKKAGKGVICVSSVVPQKPKSICFLLVLWRSTSGM